MGLFIALAKGELGRDIEEYMKSIGQEITISGKPPLTQKYRENIYRIIRPRDVPRFVGDRYEFGITGKDCCIDELLGGNEEFKYLAELPFSRGEIVLYSKLDTDPSILERPRVVVSDNYENIARQAMKYLGYQDSELTVVKGSDEGYVSSGEADIGVGPKFTGDTLQRNGLKKILTLLNTCLVLIARNSPEFTLERFYEIVRGDEK